MMTRKQRGVLIIFCASSEGGHRQDAWLECMLVMNKDGGLHWQSVKTFPTSLPLAAAFEDMNHAWVTLRHAGLAEGV